MDDADRLLESVRQTLSRLEETFRSNTERLSIPNLNRALIISLRAQAAILERLASLETLLRQRPGSSVETPGGQEEPGEGDQGEDRPGTPQTSPSPERTVEIEQMVAEYAVIPSGSKLRTVLRTFRIDELNRWLESGTAFQIRERFAFVNLRELGQSGFTEVRENLATMGFDTVLGLLKSMVRTPVVVLEREKD